MELQVLHLVMFIRVWREQVIFNGFAYVSILDKDIAIGEGNLEFDSRAGQIVHSVVNGSPPLRRFFGTILSRR